VCHWYWNYTHPHDKRTNKALVISESMSVFISVDEAKFGKKRLRGSSTNTLSSLGLVHTGYVHSQGKSYYDKVLENKQ
jgi:hypothetical protein